MTVVIDMIDTIGADASRLPRKAPAVAGYVTGSLAVRWTPEDWRRFKHSQHVTIDQAAGPSADGHVLDVESGAKTIPDAIEAIRRHGRRTIYVSASSLDACRAAVNAADLKDVTFWVANWALSRAEAAAMIAGDVIGVQYASPSSNPTTKVPHGDGTLQQVNCDLSVISDRLGDRPPHPKPRRRRASLHPKIGAAALGSAITTAILVVLHDNTLHLSAAELGTITTAATLIAGFLSPNRGGNGA